MCLMSEPSLGSIEAVGGQSWPVSSRDLKLSVEVVTGHFSTRPGSPTER